MPARSVSKTSMNTENSHGARKDTARPVGRVQTEGHAFLAVRRTSASSASAPRTCVGPMNRHSSQPAGSRTPSCPDNVISVRPTAIIAASETTMTGFAPTRSSSVTAEHGADRGDHADAHPEQQHIGLRRCRRPAHPGPRRT